LIDAREWHYEALNRALALFGFTITRQEHENYYDGLPTHVKLKKLSEEK
jgi:beta-phosphoglucomutase